MIEQVKQQPIKTDRKCWSCIILIAGGVFTILAVFFLACAVHTYHMGHCALPSNPTHSTPFNLYGVQVKYPCPRPFQNKNISQDQLDEIIDEVLSDMVDYSNLNDKEIDAIFEDVNKGVSQK